MNYIYVVHFIQRQQHLFPSHIYPIVTKCLEESGFWKTDKNIDGSYDRKNDEISSLNKASNVNN